MFEWVKARVLRLMRVPHEPEPPMGAPGSARVFRAGVNHYRLRVLRWYFGQAGALIGIGFSVVVLVVAALSLVLDFDLIESGVQQGAAKYMEWYGAFALLVTLAWLYLEFLKLLMKLQRRD